MRHLKRPPGPISTPSQSEGSIEWMNQLYLRSARPTAPGECARRCRRRWPTRGSGRARAILRRADAHSSLPRCGAGTLLMNTRSWDHLAVHFDPESARGSPSRSRSNGRRSPTSHRRGPPISAGPRRPDPPAETGPVSTGHGEPKSQCRPVPRPSTRLDEPTRRSVPHRGALSRTRLLEPRTQCPPSLFLIFRMQ